MACTGRGACAEVRPGFSPWAPTAPTAPTRRRPGATAVRGDPRPFRQLGCRLFASTPWWRWRESNPRPSMHHQGFSERSSRCLYSAPPFMRTSRCGGPSRCLVSHAYPRPVRAVSHLADARIRADDEPGLTDSSSCYQAARAKSCCLGAALVGLQRMVNEIIVAFLGSLPLVNRPKSRPITPCVVVQTG